ncbi:hypothetical protein RSOLAG1IB_12378 [Rhizoctonia solani AG-1 IB]|uniref:Secreted protein n=1 Tax=Thanatephorus cucumeris (strain AG1-IB / isolate 7/3/14) TaxID=1108050 RepID=A0A0B7FSE0_THACB|nr:hypothetical protein RSOLAG1IB_12378 [Rhizoctonia solani AG-1 IB]
MSTFCSRPSVLFGAVLVIPPLLPFNPGVNSTETWLGAPLASLYSRSGAPGQPSPLHGYGGFPKPTGLGLNT